LTAAAIIIFSKTTIPAEFQNWWIGLAVVLFAIIGYIFLDKKISKREPEKFLPEAGSIFVLRFMSLEWLFNAFSFIENKIRGFVNGFSGLMEGEGGIIWAFVLLILIFSMLT